MGKKVSVKETAERMGKSESFVRVGLQRGFLPFGFAMKIKTQWSYYINPALLEKYMAGEIVQERHSILEVQRGNNVAKQA